MSWLGIRGKVEPGGAGQDNLGNKLNGSYELVLRRRGVYSWGEMATAWMRIKTSEGSGMGTGWEGLNVRSVTFRGPWYEDAADLFRLIAFIVAESAIFAASAGALTDLCY